MFPTKRKMVWLVPNYWMYCTKYIKNYCQSAGPQTNEQSSLLQQDFALFSVILSITVPIKGDMWSKMVQIQSWNKRPNLTNIFQQNSFLWNKSPIFVFCTHLLKFAFQTTVFIKENLYQFPWGPWTASVTPVFQLYPEKSIQATCEK